MTRLFFNFYRPLLLFFILTGCPQIVEIRDPSHSIIAHGSGLKSSQCGKTASFFIETGGFGEAKDFDILVICKFYLPN